MRFSPLILLLFSTAAFAGEKINFGAAPTWVVRKDVTISDKAITDGPVDLLLIDGQVRTEPDVSTVYSHVVARLNTAQGLSVGNVNINWDPAFDDVTVHRLLIYRDGKPIDVIATGGKFTVIRREQNLDAQTLDGRLTGTLQPEGLREGDVVEFEYSLARRDPTLKGHMEARNSFVTPFRAEQFHSAIITPGNARMSWRTFDTAPGVKTRTGGMDVTQWSFAPLLPTSNVEFAPDRYNRGPAAETTDFKSWADMSDLFRPLFDTASTLKPDSALAAEVARIRSASPDPKVRAEMALQLVQDKIRYVNLALGAGGLVPASADTTWERRFGDCKAKTALLMALLHALDIDAVPVLVNSETGDGLDQHLPMVSLFNHVLVRSVIGGKTYWLDGTRVGDLKLDAIQTPDLHWGLPLVKAATLVPIVPSPLDKPNFERILYTDASAGPDVPAPTKLDLVYRGDGAVVLNQSIATTQAAQRDLGLKKLLESMLDRFTVGKFTYVFDADSRTLTVHGEGTQILDVDGSTYWTDIRSPGYKADFRRSQERDAEAPVSIDYPSFRHDRQTILIPKDRIKLTTFQMPPINETVAGVEYKRTFTNKDGVVVIDLTSRSITPEISWAEAKAAEKRLRELDNDNIWIRFRTAEKVSKEDVQTLTGKAPTSWGDYMVAASKYSADGAYAKAMGALDRAVQVAPPSEPSPLIARASSRWGMGDKDGARADIGAAVKAAPRDPSAREIHALIARQSGDEAGALADANALRGVDNSTAQVTRARILVSLGRTQEAVAAFRSALVFDKDPLTHAQIADALPLSDKTGRKAELDAALKLNPRDAMTLMALARQAAQLGDDALASDLLDKAFLKSPDDVSVRIARAVALKRDGQNATADKEIAALAAKTLTPQERNNLCWALAQANVALDVAITQCDQAIAEKDIPMFRDSKGLVLIRLGRFADAVKEYDTALQNAGGDGFASAFYGRAIANGRLGDKAKSDADAAKAVNLYPTVARDYAAIGLTP